MKKIRFIHLVALVSVLFFFSTIYAKDKVPWGAIIIDDENKSLETKSSDEKSKTAEESTVKQKKKALPPSLKPVKKQISKPVKKTKPSVEAEYAETVEPKKSRISTKPAVTEGSDISNEGWSITDEGSVEGPSSWYRESDIIIQSSNINGGSNDRKEIKKTGTYAINNNESYSADNTMTADLMSNDNDTIGLIFGYQDKENYYRFSMDSQRKYRRIVKNYNGNMTVLAEDGFAYSKGKWYTIKTTVIDKNIKIYSNGVLVFDIFDDPVLKGKIGLYCWGNEGSEFKNIGVSTQQGSDNKVIAQNVATPQVSSEIAAKAVTVTPLSGWAIIDEGKVNGPSSWKLSEGKIIQTSGIRGENEGVSDLAKPGTFALKDESEYPNYTATVDMLSKSGAALGLVFGYKNDKNYYRFSMDKEKRYRRLVKNVNGKFRLLAEDSQAYAKNKWYSIKLEVIKRQIKIYLDNHILFNVSDDVKLKGKTGLYSWGNEGCEFKNFDVQQIKTQEEEEEDSKTGIKARDIAEMLKLKEDLQELQSEMEIMKEEAMARKKLEVTEQEKAKKEEDLLKAAGREYTLLQKGSVGFEYSLNYSYYAADSVEPVEDQANSNVKHLSNHNLTNTLTVEYPLLNNLTLNSDVPFAYKYNKLGTSESLDAVDLGDISVGLQFQPLKSGGKLPTSIFYGSVSLPTGISPYNIVPDGALSTGSGYYSISGGISFSEPIDPIVAYGNISYSHGFEVSGLNQNNKYVQYSNDKKQYVGYSDTLERVTPGDVIGLSVGLGYSLSYKVSLNLSYQYSYYLESDYYWKNRGVQSSGTSVSSVFSIGTGWVLSPERSIQTKISIGFTNSDPDFSISFRIPLVYDLKKK